MEDNKAVAETNTKDKNQGVDAQKREDSFEALPKPSGRRVGGSKNNYPDFSKIPSTQKVKKALILIVIIIAVGFGSGWLGAYSRDNNLAYTSAKEIVSSKSQVVTAIAKDVSPSVVSIDATSETQSQDIFGNVTTSPQESEGTGIIISSNGYILTNRHVIAGATSVNVTLADGTTINNVKVIGTTDSSDSLDVGILKINNPPEALQPALLGNSNQVQVGDDVVAIGNALGQFQNTVTSGIISGRGRTIQAGDESSTTSEDLQDLFQTDAAINPGNSGGPLININGEVIGLNTALASNGAQNIGFSIPINDVEGIIKGVLANGTIQRPYLGVYYETVTPAISKQFNLNVTNGAYIPQNQNGQNSIVSGSPADKAGLQPGDVITSVNGVNVDSSHPSRHLLTRTK